VKLKREGGKKLGFKVARRREKKKKKSASEPTEEKASFASGTVEREREKERAGSPIPQPAEGKKVQEKKNIRRGAAPLA